jgi:hypothetical protein
MSSFYSPINVSGYKTNQPPYRTDGGGGGGDPGGGGGGTERVDCVGSVNRPDTGTRWP